jgi:hypothetical protein
MSQTLLASDLDALLHVPSRYQWPTIASTFQLLQHFHDHTIYSIGPQHLQDALQVNLADKVWDHPYLMHMALALSAAHSQRLLDSLPNSDDRKQVRLKRIQAEHWQRALQRFQFEMSSPNPDFSASVAATFLSVTFLFALDDSIPLDAFISGGDDAVSSTIAPFGMAYGFRALRSNLSSISETSPWTAILTSTDDEVGTYTNETPGIDGLPIAFVELCGLGPFSSSENNKYHKLARLLTPILLLQPSINNLGKLFAFIGRVWEELKPLLLQRDEIAMLLLAYWFASLRQLGQWWVATRARTECAALVAFLKRSENVMIQQLLEYPATFGARGLDRIWTPLMVDCRSVVSK